MLKNRNARLDYARKHQMTLACMAIKGTGRLVFIDDVTAGYIGVYMVIGLYSLLILSYILQNLLDSASYCKCIMAQNILKEQTKSFLSQRNGVFILSTA